MTNPNAFSDNVNLNSSARARSRTFGVLALAFAFLAAPLTACSGASSGGGTGGSTSADECTSDQQCKGDHVCEHGSCVAPNQPAPDAGAHDSATPPPAQDSAPPPPPPPASCSSNSDCATGCCSGSVCAPASSCPICHNPGQSCTGRSDCCQSGSNVGPHGAVCLSDDSACHAECFYSSECASNCCVKLQGVSYGACGSATGHTCL